jgi:hypothetical protein
MDVAVFVSSRLWRRAGAWSDTVLFVQGGQLFLVLGNYLRVSSGIH